jgi:hypothetical protein
MKGSGLSTTDIVIAEHGRWPLLSRKPYPFIIQPQRKCDAYVFTDWGFNHGLIPTLSGAFAIGVLLLVHKIGFNGWGPGGVPQSQAVVLALVGIPLLIYGIGTSIIVHKTTVNPIANTCSMRLSILGLITLNSTTCECKCQIELAEGTIAITRRGLLKSTVCGVLLAFDSHQMPRKLIGCSKNSDQSTSWAETLFDDCHQDNRPTISTGNRFTGRLTR